MQEHAGAQVGGLWEADAVSTRTMKRERSRAHVNAWGNPHAGRVEHAPAAIEDQVEALVERAAIKWASDERYALCWSSCAVEACNEARDRGDDVSERVYAAVVAAGG